MSRLGVYDNWESLVKAVIDREHLHRLALCDSFSSASTYCVPSTPSITSSDSLHAHVGNGASTGGVVCMGPLTLPVLAIAPVNGWKKKLKDHLFGVPGEQDPEVHQLRQLENFSLHELRIATDEFSNQLILGRGGLSKVYKGQLADGSLVAVKRLHNITHHENLLSQTELRMIDMVAHPNLLRLRGFCITPEERLLVYPFMANGSVASCLRERPESQPPLDWPTRGRIALGSARGLDYLHEHCDKKIIHRDVKAANVFLNENFDAVVGDFNLAKLMDHKDSYVTTGIHGTIGHIAPEYKSSFRLSEKTDVFAYGIMLLELITGQGASTLARLANEDNVKIFDWVKCLLKTKKMETLADPNLGGNYVNEEMEKMLRVAIMCIHDSPNKRPKMSDVVRLLEGDDLGCLANRWEKWQKLNQEFFSE